MCSDYWCWFKDQGYPELDARFYSDGSWGIIQYLNAPIMPSYTRFVPMLMNIKHQEISPSFIKHHADRLNIHNRHVWDDQDRTERRALEEVNEQERRAEDFANQMMKGVRGNDDLMQRIARNGLGELNPLKMLNHVPRYRLGKGYKERN